MNDYMFLTGYAETHPYKHKCLSYHVREAQAKGFEVVESGLIPVPSTGSSDAGSYVLFYAIMLK